MFNSTRSIVKTCLAGGVVLSMMGLLRIPLVASQEVCEGTDAEPPAQTIQTVKFQQYGIQVRIPTNYRTLKRESSTWIIDPGTYNLLQCLDQGIPGPGTDAYSPEIIRRWPNPQKLSAKEFALQVDDSHLSSNVTSHRIGDREIYSREHRNGAGGIEISYAWFEGSEGNEIIELSTHGMSADLQALLNRVEMIQSSATNEPNDTSNNLIEVALQAVQEQEGGLFGRRREIIAENETLENPQRSVVTLTGEGLGDDSVKGYRYTLQLEKDVEGNWGVTDLQKSWVCQSGRGSQVYAQELCH